ncbi:serine/threonine-protein kinase bud32, partial [Spiromyces aspiralis]
MAQENWELIKQGAEAKIYKIDFYGRPAIVKERFPKTYRHPTLDTKLSQRRIVQEARCLHRCRLRGIDAPTVYFIDLEKRMLYEEYVEGATVRDALLKATTLCHHQQQQEAAVDGNHSGGKRPDSSGSQAVKHGGLMRKIGESLAKMHDSDIIHGDLTTSNMIIRDTSGSLVLIDFGLGYYSNLAEDKAVDLYVLERAFFSTHPNSEEL